MRIYIGSPQEIDFSLLCAFPVACGTLCQDVHQWSGNQGKRHPGAASLLEGKVQLGHKTSNIIQPPRLLHFWECHGGVQSCSVKSQELPVLHMLRSSPKPVHCCDFLQQKQLTRCRHHHHYQHSRVLRASSYADSQSAVFPRELVAGFPPTASSSEALPIAHIIHINQENCLVKSGEYLQFVCLHCMWSTINLSATLMTSCMHRWCFRACFLKACQCQESRTPNAQAEANFLLLDLVLC